MIETKMVNEDANYQIEMLNSNSEENEKEWLYITTEYSFSVATDVAVNIKNATGGNLRVISIRSNNQILAEI